LCVGVVGVTMLNFINGNSLNKASRVDSFLHLGLNKADTNNVCDVASPAISIALVATCSALVHS
jgi:hypothetical protein